MWSFNQKGKTKRTGGVLILTFGSDPNLLQEGETDDSIYIKYSKRIQTVNCHTVFQIVDVIKLCKPEVLHLLAEFNHAGALVDSEGDILNLSDIMKLSESCGTQLIFLASENDFENIDNKIIDSKTLTIMTILQRNKHYPVFLEKLLEGIANTKSFAMAYVGIAPQHEFVQKGLPLPGSIAVCPAKEGKRIVLWTNAQE